MPKLVLALILFALGSGLAGCAGCYKPMEYPHTYVVDHQCTLIQDNSDLHIINTGNCGR